MLNVNGMIYIRTVSSYRHLSALMNKFKLDNWLFGQSNMHHLLDFYPRPTWKETNVPLHKLSRSLCISEAKRLLF